MSPQLPGRRGQPGGDQALLPENGDRTRGNDLDLCQGKLDIGKIAFWKGGQALAHLPRAVVESLSLGVFKNLWMWHLGTGVSAGGMVKLNDHLRGLYQLNNSLIL